jgi:hypothetical protein
VETYCMRRRSLSSRASRRPWRGRRRTSSPADARARLDLWWCVCDWCVPGGLCPHSKAASFNRLHTLDHPRAPISNPLSLSHTHTHTQLISITRQQRRQSTHTLHHFTTPTPPPNRQKLVRRTRRRTTSQNVGTERACAQQGRRVLLVSSRCGQAAQGMARGELVDI